MGTVATGIDEGDSVERVPVGREGRHERVGEAGGSVERFDEDAAAPAWLQARADEAGGAVAETGSLILYARDGRAAQLLPPVHLVVVDAAAVHTMLAEAFADLADDLPSALGLHSGPSKSADLGKVMVTGVHGLGKVVAVVVG